MRGRKRKPAVLHLIAGNPGKRPLNNDEPRAPGELSVAPAWMNEAQRKFWDQATENAPAGMLRKIDRDLLASWAVAAELYADAAMKLGRGRLVRNRDGMAVPSPYLRILRESFNEMLKASTELGFSPTSRARLSIPQGKEKGNRFANNGRKPSSAA